jgi:GNAT superfamily N-acetyltransferase
MTTPLFIHASAQSPSALHDSLLGLQAEYLSWVHREMAQCIPEVELPQANGDVDVVQALCAGLSTGSALYLIEVDGKAAGMCGLRRLAGNIAEIKRLYVRPAYRGMQLGSSALQRLLADAHRWGHTHLCLDTAPFMEAAHRLYDTHGFTDCAEYEGTEVPVAWHSQWRFMQRSIAPARP